MTVVYQNQCYNEVCYKGTALYILMKVNVLQKLIFSCFQLLQHCRQVNVLLKWLTRWYYQRRTLTGITLVPILTQE